MKPWLNNKKSVITPSHPSGLFNNNFAFESVDTPEQDKLRYSKVYFAIKDHVPTAYAYETIAPDGYSGNIRLLVGITSAGEVSVSESSNIMKLQDWAIKSNFAFD